MRYIDKIINGKKINFLELRIYDENDVAELKKYNTVYAISVSIEDLMYLSQFDNVRYLHVTSGEADSSRWNYVYALKDLKALVLDYEETDDFSEYSVDCSKLKSVEYIFSCSSLNIMNINCSSSLKTLIVENWYQENLTSFYECDIDTLCIFNGMLTSLDGIERLKHLKVLSLRNLKLDSIKELSMLSELRFFEIEQCKEIKDIEVLGNIKTLEYLIVKLDFGIESLTFINELIKLKCVVLDVKIKNGDLKPLQRLDDVKVLTNRKNYNVNIKDLPHSKHDFIIETIPEWRSYTTLINKIRFVKYSTESESPASSIIIDILSKLFDYFNDNFDNQYCDELDSIFICPVCTSELLNANGFYKDRKYISHSKRYADIRLSIDYLDFIKGNEDYKVQLIIDNVISSVEVISKKMTSFNKELFLHDFYVSVKTVYPKLKSDTLFSKQEWTNA